MADLPNEAPAPTNGESEATQTNNEPINGVTESQAPANTPDMQGFTPEQLADMKKFFDANGGFDKVKSRLSNPPKPENTDASQKSEPASQNEQSQPTQQTQSNLLNGQQKYTPPEGSITQAELLAQQYFLGLSNESQYASIKDQIADGSVLKEMGGFGIRALNADGSINDGMVRKFLDLKAQTVPAKSTSTEPNESNAPTVQFVDVGDNFTSLNQAYDVLMQDAELKSKGLAGHPRIADAEKFIRENLNKQK